MILLKINYVPCMIIYYILFMSHNPKKASLSFSSRVLKLRIYIQKSSTNLPKNLPPIRRVGTGEQGFGDDETMTSM